MTTVYICFEFISYIINTSVMEEMDNEGSVC